MGRKIEIEKGGRGEANTFCTTTIQFKSAWQVIQDHRARRKRKRKRKERRTNKRKKES
jgi:hypothetical protein